MLATFGAQVIRVEWRERKAIDFIRYVPPFAPDHATADGGRSQGVTRGHGIRGSYNRAGYFNNTNPGKYGVTLNLNHAKGRELLRRLVRDANAICENFSPGQMDKWDLGYDELRKINPRIIYMQTTGMGKAGVYEDYVSYGPTAQAFSGLTLLSGLPEPRPPAGWGYSYLDHSPGYFGAIMLMAAIRRQRHRAAPDATSTCRSARPASCSRALRSSNIKSPASRLRDMAIGCRFSIGRRMALIDASGERQLDRDLDSIRRAVARADRGDGLARIGRSMIASRAPLRASSTKTNSMRSSQPSLSDANAMI